MSMTTKQDKAIAKIVENGGNISGKELKELGYSEAIVKNPKRVIRSKAVQSELSKVLKKKGITLSKALQPVIDALLANKMDKNGNIQPDHLIRLAASDRAVKLIELTKPKEAPKENNLRPELAQALLNGDIEEMQRIIFKTGDNLSKNPQNTTNNANNSSIIEHI